MEMAERAVALRETADEHDDAAQALRHHADEDDRLKDLIREIAHRVRGLIEGARSRLADLADKALDLIKKVTPDPIDEMLSSFQPPPEGHKDWRDVPDQLPGGGDERGPAGRPGQRGRAAHGRPATRTTLPRGPRSLRPARRGGVARRADGRIDRLAREPRRAARSPT